MGRQTARTRTLSGPDISPAKPHRPKPGFGMGLSAETTSGMIAQIEQGFAFSAFQRFASTSGMSLMQLASVLGIPERTLARRRIAGRLAPDESDRLLRVSTIVEKAMDLFEGDRPAAMQWLTTPKKALDNHSPLAY
jgi:putative toxin-antitoxin system antitoxin component (TIGR02293 family)